MSEFGKTEATLLAFGAAAAVAISGCTSDSPEAASASSHSAVQSAVKSAQSAPDKQIITDHVDKGPVGALRDQALTIAYEVSDIDATPDDAHEAYIDASAIPNVDIRNKTVTYIDWRLASTTRYLDSRLYTFPGYDDSQDDNHDHDAVQAAEALLKGIHDPTIQATAEKNLDYVEANAAVKAGTGSSPNTQLAAYLLSTVQDQGVLTAAKQAIGANQSETGPYLNTDAEQLDSTVQSDESAAYSDLYDGSNTQAQSINDQISAFNKARSESGN